MVDQYLFNKISRIHLPVELVVKILNNLSAKELVLWQGVGSFYLCCVFVEELTGSDTQVSKQFRDVIKDSVVLQYRIQCCMSGVLEEPMSPLRNKAAQRTAMREWSQAWKNAEWKMVLTEATALAQGLSLDHPPSIIRGMQHKEHDFGDLHGNGGYGFGAEHNVLVVARPEGHPGIFRLAALDPATRQQHSDVYEHPFGDMMVDTRLGTLLGDSLEIIVQGSTVMCLACYEDHPAGPLHVLEYWWFDWKHSCLNMHFLNDSEEDVKLDTYTLLDEEYMVAAINCWSKAMVAVFYREEVDTDHCTVPRILRDAVVVFELPQLHEDAFYSFLITESQIVRDKLPANYLDANFTPSNVSPVIHINLPVLHHTTPSSFCYYELLIPAESIRKHIDLWDPERPLVKPWDDWSSDVRLFEGKKATRGVVSGSRYAATEADPETGKRVVMLYDFCPLEGTLRDLCHGENVGIQLTPNEIKDEFLLKGEVKTSAPYRRVKTGIALEEGEEPKLTEDGITVVKEEVGVPSRKTRAHCI